MGTESSPGNLERKRATLWQRLVNSPVYQTEIAHDTAIVLQEALLLQRRTQHDWLSDVQQRIIRFLRGRDILELLPENVTSLSLRDALSVTRDPKKVARIPEDKREEWDLYRVEEYAASLAEQAGVPWRPIFPRIPD